MSLADVENFYVHKIHKINKKKIHFSRNYLIRYGQREVNNSLKATHYVARVAKIKYLAANIDPFHIKYITYRSLRFGHLIALKTHIVMPPTVDF